MRKNNIGRPTSTRYRWTIEQKQKMRLLYESDKMSLEDIALHFDTSRETIRYHLRKSGMTLRGHGCTTDRAKDKQRGSNHHSWAGGRYRHRSGYYYALARGHPHAKYDYVYEHRLVMERHLLKVEPTHPAIVNGYLSRSWVVHHKNGVKTNNRIENLEAIPRGQHHSWMHYHDEMQRMRDALDRHGISY